MLRQRVRNREGKNLETKPRANSPISNELNREFRGWKGDRKVRRGKTRRHDVRFPLFARKPRTMQRSVMNRKLGDSVYARY